MTAAEKALRSEKSKAFWSSDVGQALKKEHGARLGKWNATRHRPLAERKAASERMRVVAKTREFSAEERQKLSDRCKERMQSGWVRPPMTEEERIAASKRMMGNNFGANNKMSDEHKEMHRQRMLKNNPGNTFGGTVKNSGPNKSEARLDEIVSPLGFEFVGDAMFWLKKGPSGRSRNPDWVYKDRERKLAILHHGEYWHKLRAEDDAEAMKDYEFWGWKVLVVWEKENRKSNAANLAIVVKSWLLEMLGGENDKCDA